MAHHGIGIRVHHILASQLKQYITTVSNRKGEGRTRQDRVVVLLYNIDLICEYLDNRNGPEFEIPYQLDCILGRRVI
jgi:hypothetical protein